MTRCNGYNLRQWEEVVGILNKLHVDGGKMTLFISSSFCIVLEVSGDVDEKVLREAIGRKVGVLRTDSSYRLRVFCKSNVEE